MIFIRSWGDSHILHFYIINNILLESLLRDGGFMIRNFDRKEIINSLKEPLGAGKVLVVAGSGDELIEYGWSYLILRKE